MRQRGGYEMTVSAADMRLPVEHTEQEKARAREQRRRARLRVAHESARLPKGEREADCRELLAMLGLAGEETP